MMKSYQYLQRKKTEAALKRIYRICPGRHTLLLVSGALVLLFLALRNNRELMRKLSDCAVRPLHRGLSVFCSRFPFSVGEMLIAAAVIFLLVCLFFFLRWIIKKPKKLKTAYRFLMTLLSFGMTVYAGFCFLWGVYYYGDSFAEKSGFDREPISTEQLAKVTAYFAEMANEYSEQVDRDENGFYQADFETILADSDRVFENTEKDWPCLTGPAIQAKSFLHSRLMSYTDFTGFFFPFTAEANVNTDVTSAYFASTVAHELSHQRGVAQEDEANFVAVLASLNYGDPDYVYSASLLAYCHLGNALYKADRDSWREIVSLLNDKVLGDYEAEEEYWEQFRTPVKEISNTVYENFLYSYDQDLGLKSYGACVDLLVNYYEKFCD